MNSIKYVHEKLNLSTLNPIFISSDQKSNLSPVTDFVVNENRVLIVNQSKLEKLLSEDMEILDDYVNSIKSRNFDLGNFINNKLSIDIDELAKTKINVEGYLSNNEVKSFISSLGQPYIPGSSIKGAIRTAIMYNYLISNKVKIVDDILAETVKRYPKILKLYDIQKNRKLSFKERKELKNLRNFNSYYNELKIFKTSENKLNKYGKNYSIDLGHEFRKFQLSDSEFMRSENTKIIEVFRQYLTHYKQNSSQWVQVLNEKTTTKFNFKIEKPFNDSFLQKINSDDYQEIFKMINKFSLDNIDFELNMFNEFINNAKKDRNKIQEQLNGTIQYYKKLKDHITFARNICAVFRIGGGKTYFDNSIGLALYKKDPAKFKQFRKLLGFWKHRSGNRGFVEEDSPITRTFYYSKDLNEYLPLGWIVIYFEKDKEDIEKIFHFNFSSISNTNQNDQETNTLNENESDELDLSKLSNLGRIVKK